MEGTIADLAPAELDAIRAFVEALINRDEAALAAAGAYDRGSDPYLWVSSYGADGVDLVHPPGPPSTWLGSVNRAPETPGWAGVCVEMYDRVQGRTDLTLEVDLRSSADGVDAVFVGLHVV